MPDAQMQKERKIIEIYKAAQEKKLPSDVFIEKYGKQINQAFKRGEISSEQIVSLCLSLSAEHGPDALKKRSLVRKMWSVWQTTSYWRLSDLS